jgi:peptidoglycan hydrolase-like protein with peptidoglycan-binding domain
MDGRIAPLLLAVALAACSRERTYRSPPEAGGAAQPTDTWVGQPSDLSPEQVRTVQRALVDRGFPIELSGAFDAQTRTAMGDFQRSRGLPATGNLTPDTAEALGLDPREVMPVRGSGADHEPADPARRDDAVPERPDEAAPERLEPRY